MPDRGSNEARNGMQHDAGQTHKIPAAERISDDILNYYSSTWHKRREPNTQCNYSRRQRENFAVLLLLITVKIFSRLGESKMRHVTLAHALFEGERIFSS
jgi:hypothetical protein